MIAWHAFLIFTASCNAILLMHLIESVAGRFPPARGVFHDES